MKQKMEEQTMKKIILLLIIPFLLPDHLFAQMVPDYFPIHVGDYWILHADTISGVYQPTTYRVDIEAIDLIGGDEYFRMRQGYSADDGSSEGHWYLWIREDSTGGVIGAFGDTSIVDSSTIYDPPLPSFPNEAVNQGYSWEFDFPTMGPGGDHWSCLVESISETVQVPVGEFNDCLKIRTIITDNASGDTTQWIYNYYAEGIGQVLYMGWNFFWENFKFELIEYSVQSPVDVRESPSVPIHINLQQNYPNPFNPTTTISYQLPKSSFVKLTIYDVSGRLIETLVDEKKNAGYYSIQWDASQFSSGVYIYRIQADGFSAVKKCLLIK